MAGKPERRARFEIRAEGRKLSGPAIVYGDVSPSHRERFEGGAFQLDNRTRWLDVRHDRASVIAFTNGGGLELEATDRGLEVRAELPEIPAADMALAAVQRGELTGFSIEFLALEERQQDGLRVIARAELLGVGLVPSPSYAQSQAELRSAERLRRWRF